MIRRALIFTGILCISLILAFPLRDAVYAMIIIPAAYVFWMLSLFYRSLHQSLWWGIASVIVLFILIRGLLPQPRKRADPAPKPSKPAGQVEALSTWMKKAEQGIYFKWLVANRIGRIAHLILTHRETGRQRSLFDPLTGPGWEPDLAVQSYLEAGLQGSFADYPKTGRFFSKPVSTPMDHDVTEVLQYLESQIEK